MSKSQANSFPFEFSPDITLSRLTPPFCLLSSAISFWALKNRSTTFRTKKIRNVSKVFENATYFWTKEEMQKVSDSKSANHLYTAIFLGLCNSKGWDCNIHQLLLQLFDAFFRLIFPIQIKSWKPTSKTKRFRVSSQDSTICNSDS